MPGTLVPNGNDIIEIPLLTVTGDNGELYSLDGCQISVGGGIIANSAEDSVSIDNTISDAKVVIVLKNKLNSILVDLVITKTDNTNIKTITADDLDNNYEDYLGEIVRFKGTLERSWSNVLDGVWIEVGAGILSVFRLGNGDIEWIEGEEYEIIGIPIRYEEHMQFRADGFMMNAVYPLWVKKLN